MSRETLNWERPRLRRARAWRRFERVVVVLMMGACLVAPAVTAVAATVVVGCSPAELIEAVKATNNEATHPGHDTLSLSAGCTYSFTERYEYDYALPAITGELSINGNGARLARSPTAESMTLASIPGVLVVSNATLDGFYGHFRVGGRLVLSNSVIRNDPTRATDSAIRVHSRGEAVIVDSRFQGQFLPAFHGAAIDNSGGNLLVVRGTFSFLEVGFPVEHNHGEAGGAIANQGVARIYESTFMANFAGDDGGAIWNSGVLEIYESSFVANRANRGGAIANGGHLVVEKSYFEANEAVKDFEGWAAYVGGGALSNGAHGFAVVRNSTFYRNKAEALSLGGGSALNQHSLRFEFSTLSEGHIDSPAGTTELKASILDKHSCRGNVVDLGDNLQTDAWRNCPSTIKAGNSKLAAPAMRGGHTKTMALGPGSAAYNWVPASRCASTDQRGMPRPVGGGCDAGALEDQALSTPGVPTLTTGESPNNGAFGLAWTPSIDPEGMPVTYRLHHKDADDAKYGLVATSSSASYSFGPPSETEGTFRYGLFATDGNNVTPFSTVSDPVVVDRSAPAAPPAMPDRSPDFDGVTDWYRDLVTVTFGQSVDPILQDGSPGSGIASVSDPIDLSSSGTETVHGYAIDRAGNRSLETTLVVNVDADAPTVAFSSCPSSVILGSRASAAWSASDPSSGLATPSSGAIALDTATIGTKQVVAEAVDNVGHRASTTCTYRVIFRFTGFLRPIENPPTLNDFAAGDVVRLSFELEGAPGPDVIAHGYPQSAVIDCATSPSLIKGAATSAHAPLSFSQKRGVGRYTYYWATERGWAGTCRQVIVKLIDGTYHRANLRLT